MSGIEEIRFACLMSRSCEISLQMATSTQTTSI